MELVEGKFGHGAVKKKYDIRDRKSRNLGMATIPFDWDRGFSVKDKVGNLIIENQGESGSCGGQAARYYLEVLKQIETGVFERLSAKDPYCQIFYPGGGTDIRSIGRICTQQGRGIRSEALVPSYMHGNLPTEAFMEDKSVSNTAPLHFFRPDAYAFSNTDIESIAQAIRDNNGCIIQINGQNNGTWLSQFPQRPVTKQWSHFLYAGEAKLIKGVKHIGFANSWGSEVGLGGWQWINEAYFTSKNITSALVFYKSAVTPYTPTTAQATLSTFPTWIVRLVNWLGNYLH